MNTESWIDDALRALDEHHLRRGLFTWPEAGGKIRVDGKTFLNFASNDYLDFLQRPELKEAAAAAARAYGSGSGASRLVSGSLPIHDELESAMAAFKGYPAALLFGSGYMTNVGVIGALTGRGDRIFADRLIHASLIDAVRMSGAELQRFRHNDAGDLAKRLEARPASTGKTLVITESVFSMDGDRAPLTDICRIAGEHGAMVLVDEAHATGIWGPGGRGLIVEDGCCHQVNISMSTFSKALGGYGGIVACSVPMRDWLINKARAFIYTTAPPPASCGAALAALRVLEARPQLGAELRARADAFRRALNDRGFDTGASTTQIIPVMVGDNETTMNMAEALRSCGIIAGAIRPPTVPVGTARLRLSVTLAHQPGDLVHAADVLVECASRAGWRR